MFWLIPQLRSTLDEYNLQTYKCSKTLCLSSVSYIKLILNRMKCLHIIISINYLFNVFNSNDILTNFVIIMI